MKLRSIHIISFRSIIDLKLNFDDGKITTLCGPNNVGKTNILRAIHSFFKGDIAILSEDDILDHVEQGSRGSNRKVHIKGLFNDDTNNYEINLQFVPRVAGKEETFILSGKRYTTSSRNNIVMDADECFNILSAFRIFFIEANKTDINNVVQEIFIEEVLPVLDKAKSRQSASLADLQKFQATSSTLLQSIEKDLSKNLQSFILDVEGISSQNWKIKIVFPEFTKLRQAISRLVTLTVNDANDKDLEFKGSGVQKIILLSVMRYISNNQHGNVIWLIDEPEAFLQPSLQKEVFKEFTELVKSYPVIVTTHSPHFVNIDALDNTHLIKALREPKEYVRKPGHKYMAVLTKISEAKGYEKIEEIRDHLGVGSNDSWTVTPYNLIVEGEDDKKYISTILRKLGKATPNILVAGGASKIKSFLQYLKIFSRDLNSKPKVLCIYDHDDEGIKSFNETKESKLTQSMALVDDHTLGLI